MGIAEELLRAGADERRYKTLLESVSDLVVVLDAEARVTYVNPSAGRVVSNQTASLVGRSAFDFFDGEITPDLLQSFKDFAANLSGTLGPIVVKIRDFKNRPRHLEMLLTNLLHDPAVQGIVVSARDVSDRIGAEERLRRSEEWAQTLVQRRTDLLSITDAGGHFKWVSASVESLLGYTPEELMGRFAPELAHEDDRERVVEVFATAAADPAAVATALRVRVRCADGHYVWLSGTAANLLDSPAVAGLVITAHDVTEQVRAEEALAQSERRFRALVQHSSDITLLFGADGTLRYSSPAANRIVGIRQLQPAHNVLDLLHPDDRALAAETFGRTLEEGRAGPIEVRLAARDGGWRWIEFVGTNRFEDPDVRGIVVNGRDVTERKQADYLQADETDLLESIAKGGLLPDLLNNVAGLVERQIDGALVSVGVLDPDGVIRHPAAPSLPRALVELLDASPSDGEVGKAIRAAGGKLLVFDDILVDPRWSDMQAVLAEHGQNTCWVQPMIAADTDELVGVVAAFLRARRQPSPAELAALARTQHLAAIAVERAHFEGRLEHQALHDALTGLPNRILLLDRIEQALARAQRLGNELAVLFVDLDRFKVINDSLGHPVGDRLLRQVGECFRAAVPSGDTVGRFGGDEFVVVCEDVTGEAGAIAIAERLAASLAEPFDLTYGSHVRGSGSRAESAVTVTCSIGIALVGDSVTAELLVRNADAAMYRAKDEGRNRYALFEDELHQRMVRRLELDRDLRAAVERGDLRVAYQPLVRLSDHGIFGVEALVRWQRAGHGLVGAPAFVPFAEETGLIVAIDEWVLGEACRQIVEWDALAPGLAVSVNLSARQLAMPGLVDLVAGVLSDTGLRAERLCLEVTESALASHAERSARVLLALKALGVRLAIDDFGTGYATLDYVRRFSMADELKIDRSFVRGLTGFDVPDAAIVSAAIVLATALGFDTVAEGVDHPSQLEVLRELGCQRAQGHLFSPALLPDAAARLLAVRPS